jgi:calcineurin-like phosphoesterase family protein
VRSLVLSDTHFGAWTGDDLLRHDWAVQRLAPHLEGVAELVILGDLFDFLFATVPDAFAAADPFFDLVADKMAGKRVVWLAGNHDRHIMARELENLNEEMLATGRSAEEVGPALREHNYFLRFMHRRLPECEVAIEYPTYAIGDVLCCHGHYLDAHVQGSMANRTFTRGLRRVGGVKTHGRDLAIDDYEAATSPLTELLFTVAQLPMGTDAQMGLLAEVQRIGRIVRAVSMPGREIERFAQGIADRAKSLVRAGGGIEAATSGPIEGSAGSPRNLARMIAPDEPVERALRAYAQVAKNLGWDRRYDKLVFAHTHQPLAAATAPPLEGESAQPVRFWNTGCWIYEPTLGSLESYERYLHIAWPGTAVLVDTEAPEPELVQPLADLNPLHPGGERLPSGSAPSIYRRARQAGKTFYDLTRSRTAATTPPPATTPPASSAGS